jgi:hypothetical protein
MFSIELKEPFLAGTIVLLESLGSITKETGRKPLGMVA